MMSPIISNADNTHDITSCFTKNTFIVLVNKPLSPTHIEYEI